MELHTIHKFDELLAHYNLLGGAGAEIGVAEGRTSLEFMQMNIASKLYLVDLWEHDTTSPGDAGNTQEWHNKNMNMCKSALSKFGDKIFFLRGYSKDMAVHVTDGSLNFIYIDAGHSYKNVIEDLTAWVPKLVPGGICAGHDFLNMSYGVNAAVKDFTKNKYELHTIPEEHTDNAGFWFQNSIKTI